MLAQARWIALPAGWTLGFIFISSGVISTTYYGPLTLSALPLASTMFAYIVVADVQYGMRDTGPEPATYSFCGSEHASYFVMDR